MASAIDQEFRIATELALFKSRLECDRPRCPETICRLLETIRDNLFSRDLTVDTLFAECHVSSSHAHDLFRKCMKCTPHEFIERTRIQVARELLDDPELDITSICYGLGFNNYRTFSRAFHRQTGCCPRRYREHAAKMTGDFV